MPALSRPGKGDT